MSIVNSRAENIKYIYESLCLESVLAFIITNYPLIPLFIACRSVESFPLSTSESQEVKSQILTL
jgi:hypothetical protein